MAYQKKTREDYQKEVQALTDKMETQLASHFVSQESIKEHLDFMSRFHRYSTHRRAVPRRTCGRFLCILGEARCPSPKG